MKSMKVLIISFLLIAGLSTNVWVVSAAGYKGINLPSDMEASIQMACPDLTRACARKEFMKIFQSARTQLTRGEANWARRYYHQFISKNFFLPKNIYSNEVHNFVFGLKKNWKVMEENDNSLRLMVEGYWPEYLGDYELPMSVYKKMKDETFANWFDREIRPGYSEPFNERSCDISKETLFADIAYCDFGGVVNFVVSKDGTRIIKLGLGQDFPPELIHFSEEIRFK